MNSKIYLTNEAERLYVLEANTCDEICSKLGITAKTFRSWKEKYDWERKKQDFLKSKLTFHNELYEFARKIMKGIVEDMDAGEKVDTGRIYAFCRLLPMFVKVKDYEDIADKRKEKFSPKGLTKEVIAQIEEDILGIPRKIETEDETDN